MFRDNNQFGCSFYGKKKTIRNNFFTCVFPGLSKRNEKNMLFHCINTITSTCYVNNRCWASTCTVAWSALDQNPAEVMWVALMIWIITAPWPHHLFNTLTYKLDGWNWTIDHLQVQEEVHWLQAQQPHIQVASNFQ